jgi:hypothetical protein
MEECMKKNKLYYIIGTLVLLNLFTLFKLNSLENYVDNYLQQNNFAANNLRNEINNIYSNVDAKLKKQASIFDSHNLTFGNLNSSNFTIPITLSVIPKEYSKGLTASLLLNDRSFPMKNEETSFVVTADAFIFDDFKLRVVLEQNGVKRIETIEGYYDLKNKYLLGINGGFSGESSYSNSSNQYYYNGKINLHVNSPQSNRAVKLSIVNDVNGSIIDEQKADPSNNMTVDVKKSIKLEAGDKLTVYAVIQDSYGLSYKCIIDVFEVDVNANSPNKHLEWEMRRLVEISDKNGKILYSAKDNMERKY